MLEMYKGVANSPETTITNDINNTDTLIYVLDETRIPAELPNLMVLGTGTSAETVKVLSIDSNIITVERGFQGVAKAWNAGTIIARNFTEYDYNTLVENIKDNSDRIGTLSTKVSPETPLTTTSQNLSGAVNEVKDDLDEHKAEYANYIANNNKFYIVAATRDLSIAGIQTIAMPFKAKALIVHTAVNGGKMFSVGETTEYAQTYITQSADGFTYRGQVNSISMVTTGGVATLGSLSIKDNSIEITWSKLGAGSVGTADVYILAIQ